MLSEFVRDHRDEIVGRCRARVSRRMVPRPTPLELEHGIPLFLRELEQTLECQLQHRSGAATAAVQHGEDLLRSGFTIAQVVYDYGDVCQTITELAIERSAPITTEEFRTLNNCLDNAIAEAVSGYARRHELDVVAEVASHANQHLGLVAQDLRSMLTSATLAFEVLRTGSVGIQGSTGDVLGHSLIGMRDRVDRSLTEVRLAAGVARQEHIAVGRFLEEIEVSALLGVHARKVRLTVPQVDPDLAVESDRQIPLVDPLELAPERVQVHASSQPCLAPCARDAGPRAVRDRGPVRRDPAEHGRASARAVCAAEQRGHRARARALRSRREDAPRCHPRLQPEPRLHVHGRPAAVPELTELSAAHGRAAAHGHAPRCKMSRVAFSTLPVADTSRRPALPPPHRSSLGWSPTCITWESPFNLGLIYEPSLRSSSAWIGRRTPSGSRPEP